MNKTIVEENITEKKIISLFFANNPAKGIASCYWNNKIETTLKSPPMQF